MMIGTERLMLREMRQSDYGDLCKILQDADVMYAYEGPFSDMEVQAWLSNQLKRQQDRGLGLNAVILKETGVMIGQCGLTLQPWKDRTLLEIGYLFQKAYWHNGYAAEAAAACKAYAFDVLDADSVCSIIRDTNTASQNVALRNGMSVADTWTKHYRGVDMPHLLYSVKRPARRAIGAMVRDAVPEDAERLLEIYSYYVENTAITFEYDTPSAEEFLGRMRLTSACYPYLVAEEGGTVLGYAYAGAFVGRAAYDRSCETTVYLDRGAQKRGLGRLLYAALEDRLRAMGILNLYACIAYPEAEDEYLTWNSAAFHAHLGFSKVGEFHKCGHKFGRWYNMIWMEKLIGEHTEGHFSV